MSFDEILSGSQQELRHGTVVLACLLLLRKPGYGYALLEQLRDLARGQHRAELVHCHGGHRRWVLNIRALVWTAARTSAARRRPLGGRRRRAGRRHRDPRRATRMTPGAALVT